jgi:hypothetical protein
MKRPNRPVPGNAGIASRLTKGIIGPACLSRSVGMKREPTYCSGEPIHEGDAVRIGAWDGSVETIVTSESADWADYWNEHGEGVILPALLLAVFTLSSGTRTWFSSGESKNETQCRKTGRAVEPAGARHCDARDKGAVLLRSEAEPADTPQIYFPLFAARTLAHRAR